MAGVTNRGKFRLFDVWMRASAIPGGAFAIFLATNATAPTADTNLKSDLTEIAVGNGYTAGGINVARNATDWDTLTEDDTLDIAFTQLKDITWTASGGPIPASGAGARWAILTDQNATLASREVLVFWDLQADRSVSVGQSLTLQNCEVRATE